MADSKDIIVRISDAESAVMVRRLEDAGIDVHDAGRHLQGKGEIGKVGALIVSESCEEAAQQMGLPGPVARRVGDAAENLVVAFGLFATGVGVAVVVAAVAYAAYSKYIDSKKEQRVDLEASVEGIYRELGALYDVAGQSNAVNRAAYDLTIAKRNLMQVMMPQLLESLNEQIRDMNDLLNSKGGILETLKRNLLSQLEGFNPKDVLDAQNAMVEFYVQRQKATIEKVQNQITVYQKEQKIINSPAPSYRVIQYPLVAQIQDNISREKALYDYHVTAGIISLEEQFEWERAILRMEHDRDIMTLEQLGAYSYKAETDRKLHEYASEMLFHQQTKRAVTFYFETSRSVVQDLFYLLNTAFGKNTDALKVLYYISRAYDATMAGIYYFIAGMQQYTKGGGYGLYLAIFYWFMSGAVPMAIMAETIEGENGTDPGSGFSLKASDLDVLVKKKRAIHIIINGTKTDTFEQTVGWARKQFANDETEDKFIVSSSLN